MAGLWGEPLPIALEASHGRRHISMEELPVLPTTVVEALRISNDLTASAGHLERVISRDVALTTRILAVANSAFMGLRRPIDSVREAVILLGTRQVRTVASLQAISPLFEVKDSTLISGNIYGRTVWLLRCGPKN